MRRRWLAVAVVASLMPLLPSCVPRTSFNVGVTASPFGTVRFLFVHCEDLGVTDVSLAVARAPAAATRPLWRIHTESPSPASMFTVGRTPLGFHEDVPLHRAMPPHRQLFARGRHDRRQVRAGVPGARSGAGARPTPGGLRHEGGVRAGRLRVSYLPRRTRSTSRPSVSTPPRRPRLAGTHAATGRSSP